MRLLSKLPLLAAYASAVVSVGGTAHAQAGQDTCGSRGLARCVWSAISLRSRRRVDALSDELEREASRAMEAGVMEPEGVQEGKP